jgi:hypothetical protein
MVYLYVNDLIYAGTSKDMVAEFKMSDLGLMRYFLAFK